MIITQATAGQNPSDFAYTFNGRRNMFNEFVIRCYKWGKRYPEGDYFTDDKTDAQQTFDSLPKSNQPRFING